MSKLTIALLQISPCSSLKENLTKGINACLAAKLGGADIALFPQMYSNGYDIYDRKFDDWKQEAITLNDDFVLTFQELSKQLNMAIGLTLLEKISYSQYPQNTLVLFDRKGRRVLTYAKVHTCDFDVERYLSSGEDFYVCDLDTDCGTVKVGAMICYDREFPESARILMLKGAELILVPNACPMEINRISQLRARAFENMLAIATCNYPINVPDCNGHSTIFDGVVYKKNENESRDTCILQAPESEGIYLATIDLDELREYRNNEIHGNAYRKPDKYQLLVKKIQLKLPLLIATP